MTSADEQLRQFELCCEKLYATAEPLERQAAQERLSIFTSTVEAIPQLEAIMTQTTNPYALFFASSSLLSILTANHNAFQSSPSPSSSSSSSSSSGDGMVVGSGGNQRSSSSWNNLSVQQIVDIRNFVLSFLGQAGHKLPHYVAQSVILLLSRITKLAW